MPSTTSFEFGDVLLVPFPFTDQSGVKRRPAVVVSSASYNQKRPDLVLIGVTSQVRKASRLDLVIAEWRKAGLVTPSAVKPVLATLEKRIVLKKLGRLEKPDRVALEALLRRIFTP